MVLAALEDRLAAVVIDREEKPREDRVKLAQLRQINPSTTTQYIKVRISRRVAAGEGVRAVRQCDLKLLAARPIRRHIGRVGAVGVF